MLREKVRRVVHQDYNFINKLKQGRIRYDNELGIPIKDMIPTDSDGIIHGDLCELHINNKLYIGWLSFRICNLFYIHCFAQMEYKCSISFTLHPLGFSNVNTQEFKEIECANRPFF